MTRKQILFRLEPEKSDLFEQKLKEMEIGKQDFFSFIVDAFLRDEIEIDLSSQSLSQQADFSELQLTNAVRKISENPELLKAISSALKPYLITDNTVANNNDNKTDNSLDNKEDDPNLTNSSFDDNNSTGDSSKDNQVKNDSNLTNISFDSNKDSINDKSSQTLDNNWQESKIEKVENQGNLDRQTLTQSSFNFELDNSTDSMERNKVEHEQSLTNPSPDGNDDNIEDNRVISNQEVARYDRFSTEVAFDSNNNSSKDSSIKSKSNHLNNTCDDSLDNNNQEKIEQRNRLYENTQGVIMGCSPFEKTNQNVSATVCYFQEFKDLPIGFVKVTHLAKALRLANHGILTRVAKKIENSVNKKIKPQVGNFIDFWDYISLSWDTDKKGKKVRVWQKIANPNTAR